MSVILEIGSKYGRLTVLRKSSTKIGYYWCKCECGNEKDIDSASLKYNRTLSCKCLHKEIMSEVAKEIRGIDPEELVGQKIRLWTVKKVAGKDIHGFWQYKCKCVCGKTKTVYRSALLPDSEGIIKSQSCGCLSAALTSERMLEKHSKDETWKEMLGQRFGKLVVIDRSKTVNNDGRYEFLCKCDCGREKSIAKNNLKRTKTCGKCGYAEAEAKKRYKAKRDSFDYESYIGKKYSQLTIIKYEGYIDSHEGHRFLCKCDCNKEKIIALYNLENGQQTCGHIQIENAIKNFNNYNRELRIAKGLDGNQYITEIIPLIRTMCFEPIKQLIMKIDYFSCGYCNEPSRELSVHHIDPINNFLRPYEEETYSNIYDINNLISLCPGCHQQAHKYYTKDIDLEIQKELQARASLRTFSSKEIQEKYNSIVEKEIKPWVKKYIINLNQNIDQINKI